MPKMTDQQLADELIAAREHILRCEGTIKKLQDDKKVLAKQLTVNVKELDELRRRYRVDKGWKKRFKWYHRLGKIFNIGGDYR